MLPSEYVIQVRIIIKNNKESTGSYTEGFEWYPPFLTNYFCSAHDYVYMHSQFPAACT